MIEDKLTREERIRLECLAQAMNGSIGRHMSPEGVIANAKRYESYIRGDTETQ